MSAVFALRFNRVERFLNSKGFWIRFGQIGEHHTKYPAIEVIHGATMNMHICTYNPKDPSGRLWALLIAGREAVKKIGVK